MRNGLLRTSQTKLILAVALFLTLFHNLTFLTKFLDAYAGADHLWLKVVSVVVVHGSVLTIVLSLSGISRLLKPVAIVLLTVSSLTAYFIDTYQVVIDSDMLVNMLETDSAEVNDLLNYRLVGYLLILGLLPATLVYKIQLTTEPFRRSLLKRIGLIAVCLATAAATLALSSDFYASFFRTQKIIRYYTNPATPIYALSKFTRNKFRDSGPNKMTVLGTDAVTPESDTHKELVVLVIGETARADHFSLNGYGRETNPLLAREDIVSFGNVTSCGTATAISVPCMFSFAQRGEFDRERSSHTENVLDVLKRSGVRILWRDNNSGSKGVADRVEYQDFRNPANNPVCDPECRDEGMLADLEQWVALHEDSDMLIVLHQMGSHGPAYHKRYPPAFEKFKPVCASNQLDQCSSEEVVNAYDNTILYTDYFLSRVIAWLKQKSPRHESSMLYFSDHGESLGESGIYLHGFPYAFAPTAQTGVPAILWSARVNTDIDLNTVRALKNKSLSHDNLFHTLLGIFEVKSEIYQPDKDLLTYIHVYP
jgi:lipid A ethanolaminephosphotransferase